MDIITDILEIVYKEITLPIITFIANTPIYASNIVLFILIATLGYIIGRFLDFFARIILSYIKLDDIFKKNNIENAFFNIKPSIYIRNLLKYYIYFYFIILGLERINLIMAILFSYLNMLYKIIIVLSIGFIVSAILERYLRSITDKKIVLNLSRGLTIYIFFIWALEIVNLPTYIFYTILSIFLIVVAISLGLFIGIILTLEYKEEIKKILK
ncbi:MAG: hypothetical protein QXQ16_00510 [Candidatus Aenigmatarchaeota archaeon]